jgi:hypothetical protein
MSKNTLTDRPPGVKPQPPPHPTFAMLRTIEHACADRDRLAAARLVTLCRVLDGREAANAA